ncbi:maleylpyruvate isomerase N-terminal domain-containing protein [Streptomyces lasalocidi]
METADFLQTLDREGRLLAAAADAAGTDAKVPTCPEWQVRDLLRHTGAVHRWAAGYITEGAAHDARSATCRSWTAPSWWPGTGTVTACWSTRWPPHPPTWSAGRSCRRPAPHRWRSGPADRHTRRPSTGTTRRRRAAVRRPRSPRTSRSTASTNCCAASTPAPGASCAPRSRASCGCARCARGRTGRKARTPCGPCGCRPS